MKKTALILTALLSILFLYGCKIVVNKMAFHPDKKNVILTGQLPLNVQEIFIETEDRVKIQSYFIPDKSSNKILIYFHGNGGNISSRLPDLMQINNFGINVLGVSYRGYGKSQGEPSEKGIYTDGKAALTYAVQSLGFSVSNVTILGRSIGTAVAINTSQNLNIAGLILVTPLTSGEDFAKAAGFGLASVFAGNSFNNIDKIVNISCPVLIIHGTQDNVVPFEMGKRIYTKIKTEKLFVKIEGASHNNLSTKYKKSYWPPINEFTTR
ncbi:MAG: alpha/beta hydrolase [Deltaproteobacteria bacterium]|nr:alpha/beta hydrolase [Deltaproteobacteria bacterium]